VIYFTINKAEINGEYRVTKGRNTFGVNLNNELPSKSQATTVPAAAAGRRERKRERF